MPTKKVAKTEEPLNLNIAEPSVLIRILQTSR